MIIGYCLFSEWAVGSQMIMFIYKDAYLAGYVETQGQDYARCGVDALGELYDPCCHCRDRCWSNCWCLSGQGDAEETLQACGIA